MEQYSTYLFLLTGFQDQSLVKLFVKSSFKKMSSVNVLKENGSEKLPDALRTLQKEFVPEIELKKLHLKMKVF